MPDTKTDWFVAAGAKSGDGSLDKPFHDPWLAFYCAAAGDVIHIAAGTYFGRYDRSSWVIDRPNLTVRGGYNRDFSLALIGTASSKKSGEGSTMIRGGFDKET